MKRLLLSLAVSGALAGCAGPIETRVNSMGQAAAVSGSYVLAETNDAESPELLMARRLVTERLNAKGLSASKTATLHLEVTVSSRDAALGLKQGDQSLSGAKPKKPFQNCKDKEYRLGIVLTRIADAEVVYRGSASEYHCNASLGDAVPGLVDAALADLGAPKGQYAAKRTGRD